MSKVQLDPELTAGLQSHPVFTQPQPPPEGVPLPEYARQQAQHTLGALPKYYGDRLPPASEYTVLYKSLLIQDKESLVVRCIIPSGGSEGTTYPVMVWFHGGGWMLGDPEMDENHLISIAVDLQLVIVNVQYRLAPEYRFPTGWLDCLEAVKWTALNADTLLHGSIEKGFLVGGDSAGAHTAAGIALHARNDPFFSASGERSRALTGQFLREPTVVHPSAYPEKYKNELRSYDENADSPLLNSERVLRSFETYLPDQEAVSSHTGEQCGPHDNRVSPLLAETHVGLPPAFIQVMEYDPLRDDGVVYEKILREAGVTTKIVKHMGVVHGFHYCFPGIRAALEVDRETREGLKWLLNLSRDTPSTVGPNTAT